MTIKTKLILNGVGIFLVIIALVAVSLISVNFIKSKLSYLTGHSTPYQVKSLEFQKAVQEVIIDLIKAGNSKTVKEFKESAAQTGAALSEIKAIEDAIESLSAGTKKKTYEELKEASDKLFEMTDKRLKAEDDVARAEKDIAGLLGNAVSELKQLDDGIRKMQISSLTQFNSILSWLDDKFFKEITDVKTAKYLFKDFQATLYELQHSSGGQNAAKADIILAKLMENDYVKDAEALKEDIGALKKLTTGFSEAEMSKKMSSAIAKVEDSEKTVQKRYEHYFSRLSLLERQMHLMNTVLASKSALFEDTLIIERESEKLFAASTKGEIDYAQNELNKTFERFTGIRNNMNNACSKLTKTGMSMDTETKLFMDMEQSLESIRKLLFARDGVIMKTRYRIKMLDEAKEVAKGLSDIAARQVTARKETVGIAYQEQGKAVASVNKVVGFSTSFTIVIGAIAAIFGLSIGMWAYRSITTPVNRLNETLIRMNTIIDNMVDGLLFTDSRGRIVRTNRAINAMFGYGSKEASNGKDAADVFGPAIGDLAKNAPREAGEHPVVKEIELPHGRIGKAVVTVIPNGDDDCVGSLIMARDITIEKEIDKMKTDFISTVSHELRTPLTSVLGFARIIKNDLENIIVPKVTADDKKTARAVRETGENLNIIISEGERLTTLINDVLDIAKMEAGRIEWKMEAVSVPELLERATAATMSLFEQKGLNLAKDIEDALPDVIGDRDRLMQVVINLISNAVKFTDRGTVTVKAKKTGNEITVNVIDTGVGIAKEDFDKVFEKFKQVGDTLTDRPKGTGLGLPICKQIIGHNGGRIWVESEPGKGSIFSFALPVMAAKSPQAEIINVSSLIERLRLHVETTAHMPDGVEKSILVVDDDDNIRRLLRQELEAKGYRVKESANGMDAVRQVKKEPPDLVILDIMMPDMNGLDVAAVIKNDPATMKLPIIILSVLEDKNRGYRLGVDRYFTKPVDMPGLLGEIETLITQVASKKKIMVVDEDESTVKALTGLLEAKDYQVVASFNGSECIDRAVIERPDMIIIDAVLSDKHNIAKTLRFEKGLENVYFVFIAGKNEMGGQF